MEKKINVLEVNNIDLPGRRFNGYDLLNETKDDRVDIKQMVIHKQSKNDKVIKLLKNYEEMLLLEKLEEFEKNELSVHSNLSITSPALINSKEYKEADVLHFHMFHNTKLSLISLLQICNEKKVVMSFHDPWSITGRCVHFGECMKWQTGCNECENLSTLFEFQEDNCNSMWKLKKMVYEKINPDIVVSSKYMYDLIKQSPLTKHFTNVHIIPLGIDLEYFKNKIEKEKARKKLNIPEEDIVLFLRAQNALKGTKYVLEALKKLKTDKKITVITCDEKNRLDEVKDKYNVIDMGNINNEELLYAYNACDMFLMPSTGETFGMMAIEAMACSKPVIIFNNTALPSVTFAPECGYLVENKNSDKLKDAIEQLINNEEEREKRGKLGREICEKNYDITSYNDKLIEIYKKCYENKSFTKKSILSLETNVNKEVKKIKGKLDKLTSQIYGAETKNYKELVFGNTSDINGNIDYADLDVQKTINNYNNNLYLLVSKKENNNNIIKQVKNAINLAIKDREKLKHSILYKFNKIIKRK